MNPHTVTAMIALLEKRSLLYRTPNPDSRDAAVSTSIDGRVADEAACCLLRDGVGAVPASVSAGRRARRPSSFLKRSQRRDDAQARGPLLRLLGLNRSLQKRTNEDRIQICVESDRNKIVYELSGITIRPIRFSPVGRRFISYSLNVISPCDNFTRGPDDI